MKHVLLLAVGVAVLMAVPASSQDEDAVAALSRKVEGLEKLVARQQEFRKVVEEHMAVQQARGAELARQLAVAEKKGFAYPAPNTEARLALLKGLRALVGAKKPAVEAAPKGE